MSIFSLRQGLDCDSQAGMPTRRPACAVTLDQTQPTLERQKVARVCPPRLRPPRRIGHRLPIRLRDCKADAPRSIADFCVPFTNNLSEQDTRMKKGNKKISRGLRTKDQAVAFSFWGPQAAQDGLQCTECGAWQPASRWLRWPLAGSE